MLISLLVPPSETISDSADTRFSSPARTPDRRLRSGLDSDESGHTVAAVNSGADVDERYRSCLRLYHLRPHAHHCFRRLISLTAFPGPTEPAAVPGSRNH